MGVNALKILKRDAVGRVSYSPERREGILDEFERSGLKGAAFARTIGLRYSTFAAWIQRRRHERGDYGRIGSPAESGPGKTVQLMEVLLAKPEAAEVAEDAPALRVELRCGTCLLVGDERQAMLAARILQALASGTPC